MDKEREQEILDTLDVLRNRLKAKRKNARRPLLVTRKLARDILLWTQGQITVCAKFYELQVKNVGAGVQEIWAEKKRKNNE